MIDMQKIDEVMAQTGADYETVKAALLTSEGDVRIAVNIIRSYKMRDDAQNQEKAWDTGREEQDGGSDNEREETRTAGETDGSDARQARKVTAQSILDAIKEIWRRGNASYLSIEKGGKEVLNLSLTIGAIGVVLAPVAALIGIGAAFITEYKIKIVLDNGDVVDVNEFAFRRAHERQPKETPEQDSSAPDETAAAGDREEAPENKKGAEHDDEAR